MLSGAVRWVSPMRATPPPPVAKTVTERRDFYRSISRIGSHLRGRVVGPVCHTAYGVPVWRVEVYNTKTGRVVWDDDAFTWGDAVNGAREHATVARLAWFFSFNGKALR